MKTILLSSIIIPEDRQRKKFDETSAGELMGSIASVGLLCPIILDFSKDEVASLVAGECRYKAISMLHKLGKAITHMRAEVPLGSIPYLSYAELTPLQRQEIEYAENAYRQDLTWQENVAATERLHALRTAQKLAEPFALTQTVSDTAQEIFGRSDGSYRDTVRSSLVVASHMDNPSVAKASTLKEATKIIKRIEETKRHEYLASVVGKVSLSERYKVYNEEALSWMKNQPNEQFDIILTDPPYGMDADSFGDAAGRMSGIEHAYSDGAAPTLELLSQCVPEWYRLAKEQAHLYIWCDIDMFIELRTLCRKAGWWTFRTPLINLKPEGGRVPWPEHGPRRSYEICLYAVKGKKPVVTIRPDYFESRLTEGNFGHGAQKPVEAYIELLLRSARPGDVVLDSFAGTGTIFPAAKALGLHAVGTELEAAAYGICLKRIGEL
jgi:site-specific DNA-methyltransferase (adenine-specific)